MKSNVISFEKIFVKVCSGLSSVPRYLQMHVNNNSNKSFIFKITIVK